MLSLDDAFDNRLQLTHPLVKTLRLLGEFRGKEELYRQQIPQVLDVLKQAAIVQSTESSNRIEGIVAPAQRIRDIVAEKTTPRDRSEREIAGYRDVLNTIHINYEAITPTPNVILQLHRDLFRYSDSPGGVWKNSPNSIVERRPDGTTFVRFEPVAPHLVAEAMNRLHELFERRWQEEEIDRLLLIPAYILDFLCIHPFRDGNGRMARLLTLLLLYKAGFAVGRFISLEKIIEESRESYYDALYRSSQNWHDSTHNLSHWTDYFLGVMIATYREFESRVGSMTVARGAKTQMVVEAINQFQGDFAISDLQAKCPNISVDLIRRILRKHKQTGDLESLGRGPTAQWRRIHTIVEK